MAGKAAPKGLGALAGKLAGGIPFLKAKVPGSARADEPFDSIEDSSTVGMDDFEPNAAPDLVPASALKAASSTSPLEVLKGVGEAVLQSRLLIGLIIAVLAFLLALAVVAYLVQRPPAPHAKAGGTTTSPGQVSPAGAEVLRRLILPPLPDNAPRIELERETGRVYTAEDLLKLRTDPGSVDISGLKAAAEAEVEALYRTVP